MQSNVAIFMSLCAIGLVMANNNVPCAYADTCAVGSEEIFSGTVTIQNGTAYGIELTGNPTLDRVLTLPDNTGTVALTSDIPAPTSLTASKSVATDGTGALTTTDTYPLTLTASKSINTNVSGELETNDVYPLTLTASKSISTDVSGNLEVNDIYPLTLTASKSINTDVSGNLETNDVYPLTLTASKSINTDVSGNLETNDVYPLTLTASKSINTDVSGNLETNDVYPLTLTADTPLKTNPSGEVTASDLVPETDLTVGSGIAGQVLAVNSGATALEFVGAGGGRWKLVASGESHETATAMSTYESSAGDSVQICWGGASSTDGVDGNYFRMTDGKRYKLVFSPNNSNLTSIINSNGYGNMGINFIGSSVDCVNGANPQSWTTSQGYGSSSMNWFYYWSAYSTYGGENSENTWTCRVLGGQVVQSAYGIQNWSGEIDLWDIYTNWVYGSDQVVAKWDISFGVRDFSSPYNLRSPAHSNGVCNTVGTTTGGNVSKMSEMYGFYFTNFKPSGTGGNGIMYWLYESNDFDNRP
jgi:hypothetical protein